MLKALVNEALQGSNAHEYSINDKGNLDGYGYEVTIYGRAYLVEYKDCSNCDWTHVNCRDCERVTTSPAEALENLALVNTMMKVG